MEFCLVETPIGAMRLEADGNGLTAARFVDGKEGPAMPGKDTCLADAAAQLAEYFAGRRCAFDVPLSPRGTPFQRAVWAELCRIPWGETRCYQQVAAAVGNPKATRAVGMANNRNPLLIFIPCHRVVGKDGALVGYGAGLERKRFLLELEGIRD